MASQVDADIPISSTPVVMLSPPDTQDAPQDVFHTPPEESLLPSSDVDVPHPPCTVNQAVDLDAGSQAFVDLAGLSDSSEFVDFGKDSELGFSQDAQLKNEIDADSVTENRSNVSRVLEKGVSDFVQSPLKKLKLGFDDSLESCSGVQSQKDEDGMGNCDEEKVENAFKFGDDVLPQSNGVGGEQVNDDSCGEIQMDLNSVQVEDVEMQNSVPEENVETEVVQNDGDVNMVMGNNSIDETSEGSAMRDDLEDATENGLGSGKVKKFSVFDVLRMLAEDAIKRKNETNHLTLLETAMRSGITFPRPSWVSKDKKSKLFKYDDEVEK